MDQRHYPVGVAHLEVLRLSTGATCLWSACRGVPAFKTPTKFGITLLSASVDKGQQVCPAWAAGIAP